MRRIEGVSSVENDIEAAPESAIDDRIRRDLVQSIDKQMSNYLSEEVRRIHVIVKNGNATLAGEVSSQADKDHVAVLAKAEPEAHAVANNLVVQK